MEQLPVALLVVMFTGAAAMVWMAGTRLPHYAAAIAERTGIGQGFAGFLILGGVTSLPELATTMSAAAIGAPGLALNNILGSVAFNLVLLAVGDALLGKRPLTSVVAQPATLMQGMLGIMLLALVVSAIAANDVPLGPVGVGSLALLLACGLSVWIAFRYEKYPTWVAIELADEDVGAVEDEAGQQPSGLAWRTLMFAMLILTAGTILALTGDAISEKTQIGGGLMGMLFLAVSTSLPELSAITGAMMLRRYELAIGEVFGSNLFNLGIIFLIDVASSAEPVLRSSGTFEMLGALLGLFLTGIFIVGLLERRDRSVFRMGYDSLAVIALYLAGISYLARFGD